MQEEVENRAVVLAVRTARLTGEVLKDAVSKYLAYRKEKSLLKKSRIPPGNAFSDEEPVPEPVSLRKNTRSIAISRPCISPQMMQPYPAPCQSPLMRKMTIILI